VTPVSVSTGTPGVPIRVGNEPQALVVTPDGRTLYVANITATAVVPVSTATNTLGTPIPAGDTAVGAPAAVSSAAKPTCQADCQAHPLLYFAAVLAPSDPLTRSKNGLHQVRSSHLGVTCGKRA
jgi:DNA-binding beta-propeller fold protein YncE